jgi:hypothetical protein
MLSSTGSSRRSATGDGEGMPGRAWQTSEAVRADDLGADDNAHAQSLDWGDLRSAVTVPVPIGSMTRGVLTCYSTYTGGMIPASQRSCSASWWVCPPSCSLYG